MTVKELRKILDSLPSELPVFTAYDGMAGIDDVNAILLVKNGENRGVFFCTSSADAVWALGTDKYKGGVLISGKGDT